jgi:hypothetical protein
MFARRATLGMVTVTILASGTARLAAIDPNALPANERRRLYLSLIEDFVGWAESGDRFRDSDVLEAGGGYFEAAGRGVTWARGNSNLCIAYAVLLSEQTEREHFTRHRVPRRILADHLKKTIRSLCLSNKNCSQHVSEAHRWGGPSWQSSLEFIGAAWAAQLLSDSLDDDTRQLIDEVLAREADILGKPIPSGKVGDTRSEDCIWNVAILALAANKLASDSRAKKWDELAKRWAINASSKSGDRDRDQLLDGRPLREWIDSENLYGDLTLENHGFWSVPYQFEYGLLGQADLAYHVFGQPLPEALQFRARQMWNDVCGVLSLWDGDTLFPHGQDWAWKDYQHIMYFCRQATSLQNSAAGVFESRALQMLRCRQQARGDGSVCEFDFGYQTSLVQPWAFCYLMHKYFLTAKAVSWQEAEAPLLGVHKYPYVKTIVHRTPEKLVSVSWHSHSHAIFVLPAGNRTFGNPPYFVPWERGNAVAEVDVRLTPPAVNGVTSSQPQTELLRADDADGEMRVVYRKNWGPAVSQYTTVISLPNEMTIYSTVFQAHRHADVTVERLFPLRVDTPPELYQPITQMRGKNWLNMGGHLAFLSADILPEGIPTGEFSLVAGRQFQVQSGEWFCPVALVVYVHQDTRETADLAGKIRLVQDLDKMKLAVQVQMPGGLVERDLWPQNTERR